MTSAKPKSTRDRILQRISHLASELEDCARDIDRQVDELLLLEPAKRDPEIAEIGPREILIEVYEDLVAGRHQQAIVSLHGVLWPKFDSLDAAREAYLKALAARAVAA